LFEIISNRLCNVQLIFEDLYAFLPTGTITVALIKLIHEVTAVLESNPYVIVYAIDFSKAFDTVRHSELLDKYSKMELPDCVYNWLVDFFRAHNQQESCGGAARQPSTCIVCAVAVCSVHASTLL